MADTISKQKKLSYYCYLLDSKDKQNQILNATEKWNHILGLYFRVDCGQQSTPEGTVSVTVLDLLSKFETTHFGYQM